jgi:ribonuclease D
LARVFAPPARVFDDNAAMQWVTEARDADAIAAALADAPTVGFDCEFLSQDRLVPQLCLLQVVFERDAAQQIAVLDCLAVDVGGVVAALARHPRPIAHAPRQDLQLLATRFGVELPQIFDVQTAAAFVGLGDQMGYARLVAAVLGVELVKDSQWTDWARRPLSEAQLAYATADVDHLLPLYRELLARLGPRAAWAQAESQRLAAVARRAAELRPDDAWEEVAGAGALPSKAAAVAVVLAGWRLQTARELDRPLGHVVSDKVLIDLARRPPRDADALRRRAESSVLRERADQVMALLQAAAGRPPPTLLPQRGPLGARAESLVAGLLLIVELVAAREQIAPRLLATRADVESLARAFAAGGAAAIGDHAAMTGWRRELFGELCQGWLQGRLAIVSDPWGPPGPAGDEGPAVRLVPRG